MSRAGSPRDRGRRGPSSWSAGDEVRTHPAIAATGEVLDLRRRRRGPPWNSSRAGRPADEPAAAAIAPVATAGSVGRGRRAWSPAAASDVEPLLPHAARRSTSPRPRARGATHRPILTALVRAGGRTRDAGTIARWPTTPPAAPTRASRSSRSTRPPTSSGRVRPRARRSATPAPRRTPAASTSRCTGPGRGRCASTRASAAPPRPTSASTSCSARARPASRCAFDLPTQMGYDSDHPRAEGEVGKVGVAIDSLEDMEILLHGPPARHRHHVDDDQLDGGDPAAPLRARRREAGRVADSRSAGRSRTTCSRSTSPAAPTSTRRGSRCGSSPTSSPTAASTSRSGTRSRSPATTSAKRAAPRCRRSRSRCRTAIAYVQAAVDAGLDVDEFAPRLSFFWNGHNDFFEEVAKFRAARRMWYWIMSERFGAKNEKSKLLRFHTQTAGSMLTAQQPENNVVRVVAAGAGRGARRHAEPPHQRLRRGARPAHRAGGEDRAAHPADRRVRDRHDRDRRPARRLVLRGVAHQRGRGRRPGEYIEKIDDLGGAVAAIEAGYMQDEIERAAFEWAKAVDDGEKVIVGLNKLRRPRAESSPRSSRSTRSSSASRPSGCATLRAKRDQAAVDGGARGRAGRGEGHAEPAAPDEGSAARATPRSARCPTSCATSSASTNPPAERRPAAAQSIVRFR